MNTQTLDHSSQEQLMYTQPKDPNNKNNPAYKKYCSYCHRTNHSISAYFKKQRDDEDKREAYARSKSPQKSFVQYFRSPSNDRTKHYDNRYRSRSTSRDNPYNKNYSQNRYRSTSRDRDRFRYDKNTTPPHYSRSRYDTYKRESRSYRSLTDLLIDPHIDKTLVLDTDHAPIQETTNTQSTKIHIDHLRNQEILDFLDLAHTPIPEIKSIGYNNKTKLTL